MRRGDLADLNAFVVVADHLSFRAAAAQLGVTASALSHSLRQLEERLGTQLLHRTTRSVSLTDAGLRLLAELRPAIGRIAGAIEALNQQRRQPFGLLRIYASPIAVGAVIVPMWGRFASTYPEIQLELHVDQRPIDLVASRFDVGIGPKHWAAADMIAVRLADPVKVAIVGAPGYFKRRPPPRTPGDLAAHSCIQYRFAPDGAATSWSFERNGRTRRISTAGGMTVNVPDLAVRAAVDGLGIAYTIESLAAPFLRTGQLVRVLESDSPSVESLFLVYPRHRQVSAALRAFIDMIRPSKSARGRR